MFEEMSDFEIEVEVTKILFPFVLEGGYEFLGSRDGFLYTKEDRKEHKLKGERLICTIRPYCRSPEYAWPLIEEIWEDLMEGDAYYHSHTVWDAYCIENNVSKLRAAMICFLKVKGVL